MLLNEIKFNKKPIAEEINRIDCLNLSSIWSKLIKESAKCECYSSDILIDIYPIIKAIENKTLENQVLYFGFRDCGVDHENFIKYRIESGINMYNNIFKLTIEKGFDDYVEFALYEMAV